MGTTGVITRAADDCCKQQEQVVDGANTKNDEDGSVDVVARAAGGR